MKNLKLLALLAVMPLCSFGELKYLDQSEAEEQMQRAMENPNLEGEYCKGTQKTKHKFIENIEGKIEQVLAESYAEDDPSRIPNEMLPDLGLHVWDVYDVIQAVKKRARGIVSVARTLGCDLRYSSVDLIDFTLMTKDCNMHKLFSTVKNIYGYQLFIVKDLQNGCFPQNQESNENTVENNKPKKAKKAESAAIEEEEELTEDNQHVVITIMRDIYDNMAKSY